MLDMRQPTTRYQVLGVTVLVLLVGILMMWASAPRLVSTGDEPATPANEALDEHTWGTAGCFVPGAAIDSVPGLFDFRHACTHHGGCYEGLDRHGSPAVVDRLRCDQIFRTDLVASCSVLHGSATGWRATDCRSTAERYYDVVRSFGAPYYEGAGNRA